MCVRGKTAAARRGAAAAVIQPVDSRLEGAAPGEVQFAYEFASFVFEFHTNCHCNRILRISIRVFQKYGSWPVVTRPTLSAQHSTKLGWCLCYSIR